MAQKKMKREEDSKEQEELRMTDDRRMRESGAEESGYHKPSKQDIKDIRKDHHTSTGPNAVNADEFIRHGSSTNKLQGADQEANMHPRTGPTVEEGRAIGTLADLEEGPRADMAFPEPVTPEGQTTRDHKSWDSAKRSAEGAGADGDLDLEGPVDGVISSEENTDEEDDNLERRSA